LGRGERASASAGGLRAGVAGAMVSTASQIGGAAEAAGGVGAAARNLRNKTVRGERKPLARASRPNYQRQ
jgi:hypothetical protein